MNHHDVWWDWEGIPSNVVGWDWECIFMMLLGDTGRVLSWGCLVRLRMYHQEVVGRCVPMMLSGETGRMSLRCCWMRLRVCPHDVVRWDWEGVTTMLLDETESVSPWYCQVRLKVCHQDVVAWDDIAMMLSVGCYLVRCLLSVGFHHRMSASQRELIAIRDPRLNLCGCQVSDYYWRLAECQLDCFLILDSS